MGKKRTRDADGQGDVDMTDPALDRKKDEDDSSDDEVSE
jgi:protein BCP1